MVWLASSRQWPDDASHGTALSHMGEIAEHGTLTLAVQLPLQGSSTRAICPKEAACSLAIFHLSHAA